MHQNIWNISLYQTKLNCCCRYVSAYCIFSVFDSKTNNCCNKFLFSFCIIITCTNTSQNLAWIHFSNIHILLSMFVLKKKMKSKICEILLNVDSLPEDDDDRYFFVKTQSITIKANYESVALCPSIKKRYW